MSGLKSGSILNPQSILGEGYVIESVGLVRPIVMDCPKDTYGISPEDTLFVLAIDIRYKFRCEDFKDYFNKTSAYIKAHHNYNLKKSYFFSSKQFKLLKKDKSKFYQEFKKALLSDLDCYYGTDSQRLAKEMKEEVKKIIL